VYRFDAPLFFANAEYFRQQVRRLVRSGDKPEWFMVNAEAFIYLDATALDTLRQLHGELAAEGITLAFARLKGRQREIFLGTGLTEQVGEGNFFPTVRAGVRAFEARDAAGVSPG